MTKPYTELARNLADIALEAAKPVLDIYRQNFSSHAKEDGSPVTDADLAADKIICAALQKQWPDIPVISEESAANRLPNLQRFFLVDPLDGTREFLNRTGEFTVNIALIENGRSVAGAIYAPIKHLLFIGGEIAQFCINSPDEPARDQSSMQTITVRKADMAALVALSSLSHGDRDTEAFLNSCAPCDIAKSGSSLKFCLIAKGEADFYPRFGPTMAWDIAAGDAILRAAGGLIINEFNHTQQYESAALQNGPFLALGDQTIRPQLERAFIQTARNRSHARTDIAG